DRLLAPRLDIAAIHLPSPSLNWRKASADPSHVEPQSGQHGWVKMRAYRRNRRFRLTAGAEFRAHATGIRPSHQRRKAEGIYWPPARAKSRNSMSGALLLWRETVVRPAQ